MALCKTEKGFVRWLGTLVVLLFKVGLGGFWSFEVQRFWLATVATLILKSGPGSK